MFKTNVVASIKLPNLDQTFVRQVMLDIAQQIKNDILLRTKSGKDQNQTAFIPYSPNNKKKFGQVVDLTDTGQMLNSISCKAESRNAVINVSNDYANRKTRWNEMHKNYQRSYFGLSQTNLNKIRNFFMVKVRNTFK